MPVSACLTPAKWCTLLHTLKEERQSVSTNHFKHVLQKALNTAAQFGKFHAAISDDKWWSEKRRGGVNILINIPEQPSNSVSYD